MFHADGLAERHDGAIVAFGSFANTPENALGKGTGQ